MHRPIGALLAIFARAIDRIDNPNALLLEPSGAVLLFLGQQAIIRPSRAQGMAQELIGGRIARFAQCLTFKHTRIAHIAQDAPGDSGEMGCKFGVGHSLGVHGAHLSGKIWLMIYSAASVGVISTVLTRISGVSGAS